VPHVQDHQTPVTLVLLITTDIKMETHVLVTLDSSTTVLLNVNLVDIDAQHVKELLITVQVVKPQEKEHHSVIVQPDYMKMPIKYAKIVDTNVLLVLDLPTIV
jgi:hypothetical protein